MEWTVFGVIVALIGFAAAIVKPMLTLNTSIVTLTNKIDQLATDLAKQEETNAASHDRLWRHNEKQDEKIEEHEKRITKLENTE